MSGIGIKSRWYAAIVALAIATTGGATIDTRAETSSFWPWQKKPHAIWKGVEVFESDVSYKGNATAFPGRSREKIVIKFTYIEETDFKTHGKVISHKVSWGAYRERTATGFRTWRCHSAGDMELVGTSQATIDEKLKVPCEEQKLSNPHHTKPVGPPTDPLAIPKIVSWAELRNGRSYSEEEHWGTGHHTYSVEVTRVEPCAKYNAAPKLPGGEETKAGDIQIVPDASSILPDGQTKLRITVTCDSVPVKDATLDLTIEVQAYSGTHIHQGDRPRGALDGIELKSDTDKREVVTNSKGKVDVLFEPGKSLDRHHIGIAGLYKVTAKGRNGSEESAVITAQVKGLEPLKSGEHFEIGRKPDMTHPEGSHGTTATLAMIPQFAEAFNAAQVGAIGYLTQCKNPTFEVKRLSVNDIALPRGGHFDVYASWEGSHQSHGKGTGVDFNRFKAVAATETYADCDYPPVPLRDWLLVTMYELGLKPTYGYWDNDDLKQSPPLYHLHVKQ